MSDELTPTTERPAPAPVPEVSAAPAPAPAPLPARVEQADHVHLVSVQGQAMLTAARAEAAKQAHQAALNALALAALRLENANVAALSAETERARVAAELQEKYQITGEDQISPDGAIWRKEPQA